jgi:hypothetical protein
MNPLERAAQQVEDEMEHQIGYRPLWYQPNWVNRGWRWRLLMIYRSLQGREFRGWYR